MANDFAGNPYIIDTVQVGDAVNGQLVYIKTIKWTSPAAVSGHQVQITNGAGRLIWEAVANGSAYDEESHLEPRMEWVGLKIPRLDSGRLLIYTY